jgi:hypothetical protein
VLIWLGVQVFGGNPAASYLDIFLIAAMPRPV